MHARAPKYTASFRSDHKTTEQHSGVGVCGIVCICANVEVEVYAFQKPKGPIFCLVMIAQGMLAALR